MRAADAQSHRASRRWRRAQGRSCEGRKAGPQRDRAARQAANGAEPQRGGSENLRTREPENPRTSEPQVCYFGGQVSAIIVTEVMFSRLTGSALMKRAFTSTVWPLCEGRLYSETPIR